MPYVGSQPTVGNFVKLDAIVTSATTTFNLLNGGVAYTPASVLNMIVSLNGVIQEPTTASNVGGFTVSGSTIVFTSALTTLDVIDFILVLGDVLNVGTPSDSTIGFSKVTSNLITGATSETTIAGGDSVLIYDDSASALRKMTRTNFVSGIGGTNTPAFHAYRTAGQSISTATLTKVQFNLEIFDSNSNYDNSTNYRFTPTTAGKYYCYTIISSSWSGSVGGTLNETEFRKNGTSISSTNKNAYFHDFYNSGNLDLVTSLYLGGIIDFNGSSDYLEVFHYSNASTPSITGVFGGYKIIE